MKEYIKVVESYVQRLDESHNIEGLPPDIEITDRRLLSMMDSGRYRMIAKPGIKPDYYNIEIHPLNIEKATSYQPKKYRDRNNYHDTNLSDIKEYDPDDEILSLKFPHPKDHFTTEIEPLPFDNIIYRGMSFEEYHKFLTTGKIYSNGEYNLAGQEGLTYWTTDAEAAAHYASGFAPAQFKAVFDKPTYVVAIKKPKETKRVAGTGEHEIGVSRSVDGDEVLGVWEGNVYDFRTGEYTLRPSYTGSGYEFGGGSDPSSSLIWKRIF